MRKPVPSLPVLGTDRPPVATTTAPACSGSPSRDVDAPPAVVGREAGDGRVHAAAARRAVARARSRRSRTSRARCEAGKSFADSTSSTSGRPSSRSKNAICSRSGHERTIRRTRCGGASLTKRDSSRRAGRMLQRPPPLIRILRPPSRRALEEQRVGAGGGGEDRRHRPGRPRADHDDAAALEWHRSSIRRHGSWFRLRGRRDRITTLAARLRSAAAAPT